jgi:DNA-binding transcriptional MerR regulator
MMLSYHLQSALKDLSYLIKMTESDIEDIKQAKQEPQFTRLPLKEETIRSFESKKAMIDHEISKLMMENPNEDLAKLLNDEQHDQLDMLRAKLSSLSETNQRYAKMVLSVSSFYNTLLERIVPTEMQGYTSVASRNSSSFLEVRA